jgi:hypothetical protein
VLAHVVLGQVLREPRRAQHRQVGAGGGDGPLGLLGLRLAAAGEQHQPRHAALDRELGERADDLHRARRRGVGGVRDIRGARPVKRRPHVSRRSQSNPGSAEREPTLSVLVDQNASSSSTAV